MPSIRQDIGDAVANQSPCLPAAWTDVLQERILSTDPQERGKGRQSPNRESPSTDHVCTIGHIKARTTMQRTATACQSQKGSWTSRATRWPTPEPLESQPGGKDTGISSVWFGIAADLISMTLGCKAAPSPQTQGCKSLRCISRQGLRTAQGPGCTLSH